MSLFVLSLLVMFAISLTNLAFAETYEIKIPSGASNPSAPFFWSEESTGITTGEITVFPGDSVKWSNADTSFHTITSVSAESIETREFKVDGVFDSGFFTAGKSHTQKFNELGDFYYFCSIHPFMNGVVHVVEDSDMVQYIDNVGSEFNEDGLGFKVKYILDTNLQKTVYVNPDDKSITFVISDTSENEQITFVLPLELIEDPNIVLIDGVVTEFESEDTSSGTKLIIPIHADSKEIKIMGSKVIPEFGFLVVSILSVSIMYVLFLTRSKLAMFR